MKTASLHAAHACVTYVQNADDPSLPYVMCFGIAQVKPHLHEVGVPQGPNGISVLKEIDPQEAGAVLNAQLQYTGNIVGCRVKGLWRGI
jgi:hypothetical protein